MKDWMRRRDIIIWLVIIAVAVIGFYLINDEQKEEPKTPEEIQMEIQRLENLLDQLQEDTKKAESGEAACILIYEPICGKDGRTYSNSCFAGAAGVEITHQGECE